MRNAFAIVLGLCLAAYAAAGCGRLDANDATLELDAALGEQGDAPEVSMVALPRRLSDLGRVRYFGDARDIRAVPARDAANTVTVQPGDYASLAAAIAANPNKDIELVDADYTGWGTFAISNTAGGTADRPRLISYAGADAALPPWLRSGQAKVGRITIQGAATTHWMLSGLTVAGKANESNVASGASGITIDRLWDYGSLNQYGFRVRLATDVTFQRCLIVDPAVALGAGVEAIGIAVGNIVGDVTGIRILDTEIRNYSDSIQTNDSATTPWDMVEVLIDGCDLYITPVLYRAGGLSVAENGIDLKAGSDTAYSTVIRNTRIWGFRRNDVPTDPGAAVTIHRYARNILVEDCLIGDGPAGIFETIWPAGEDLDAPRNITLRRNQYFDIRNLSGVDTGAVHRPVSNWDVQNEVYARCDYVLDVSPNGGAYRAGGPTFTNNLRIRTATQVPGVSAHPYVEANNAALAIWSGAFDSYERKRLSGPEVALGAVNMPTTYKLIRERQISVVAALTPSLLPQEGIFRLVPDHEYRTFEEWCDNAHDPFRIFEVRSGVDYQGEDEDLPGTDATRALHTQEVVIAYPRLVTWGGDRVEYIIDEDLHDLKVALGKRGYANYEALGSGLHRADLISTGRDDRETCTLLYLRFALDYDRSI